MIIWSFISDLEGGLQLCGYIPGSHSGVTVAGGVDLGYRSIADLLAYPAPLQAKLAPYVGLRGSSARAYLNKHPLTLTEDEAEAVEAPVRAAFLTEVRRQYGPAFDEIPDAAQTVIMSVTWQYGDPWSDPKCGDFWNLACGQDWGALADYLDDFPDERFISRREREARFLRAGIFEGPVPRPELDPSVEENAADGD